MWPEKQPGTVESSSLKVLHTQANTSGKVATKWGHYVMPCSSEYKQEGTPLCLLTVKVIRMRNLRKADCLSQTDCYVCLWLPTASVQEARTRTIFNCKNPIWNETFYFIVQRQVKNILELKICDEDKVTPDDHLYTVHFDIANIQLGGKVCLNFELNPKTQEELEVEFALENIPAVPENTVTNGVLVSREVCCLEVQVDEGKKETDHRKRDFTFTVEGSYEGTKKVSLDSRGPPLLDAAMFHYVKHSQSKLDITLPKNRFSCGYRTDEREMDIKGPLTVHLNSLNLGEKVTVVQNKTYGVYVKAEECHKDLDVRLGFDLCAEEQDFICKRKKVVAAALKKVLQLEEDLQDDEVPVVAIMTTAGGVRSMTAMFGSLLALQKLDILDCISYIAGLSGTTWTMTRLYEDAFWSQKDLEGPINDARKHVMQSKLGCFSLDRLKYYEKELCQRQKEGHKTTFTDLWGLLIESMFRSEENPHKLSDQRQAINQGQNPLPVYVALNVKDNFSTLDFKEWVEFTPYEVGFPKYGAFIHTEDFGSEFFMGHLMKKIPESRICFMEGMWSNIFSQSVLDALYFSGCSEDFWHRWTRNKMHVIEEWPVLPTRPGDKTCLFFPRSCLSEALRDIITHRPVLPHYHNFLKGLQMHDRYLEKDRFCMWKDTVLDSSPNELNERADYLELTDTAFFINTSCPPLLRPERTVDVILHLNYSGGLQTLPLDQAAKYYAEQGIPYPQTVLSEEDRKHLKECYLFEDTESSRAPILLYFPLVCDTFQKYKAPGVERSPTEMKQGQLNVSSTAFTPYATGMLTYTEENYNKLLNLTSYNILNNKHLILQALRTAVERRKNLKKHSSS
ncbi:PREDICTED: cytosolic phospholipase A2 epsilon-like [Crocodylus porosus]|uniref:cytosolic phospholipase A2 epsilon-like n=1 Tax=Crocodylus porosus TaxID=8502 RepID=UPI0009395740|nr:PREDICTED: cytosolic phospholipase A2 epsilon-like [Crocodylus porosus]